MGYSYLGCATGRRQLNAYSRGTVRASELELLADDSENKPSILYFRIFPAIAGQLPLLIKGGPFKPHPCPSFYYAPTLALPQWSSHNIAP